MEKNKVETIRNGDKICVLLNQYPVDIQLKTKRQRESIELESSSSDQEPPIKKRKITKKENSIDDKEPTDTSRPYSLAFPSISTSTFQFDANIAADIACIKVKEFLTQHTDPNIRLYLMDLSESTIIAKFRAVMYFLQFYEVK